MKASAVRRIAEGYLADLLDHVQDEQDVTNTAAGLLNDAVDCRLTHGNTRLVLTFDLTITDTPPADPNAPPRE